MSVMRGIVAGAGFNVRLTTLTKNGILLKMFFGRRTLNASINIIKSI